MGLGRFVKRVVGIAAPIVGGILGGPVGAAFGAALGTRYSTGSWKNAGRNAALAGAISWGAGKLAGGNSATGATNAAAASGTGVGSGTAASTGAGMSAEAGMSAYGGQISSAQALNGARAAGSATAGSLSGNLSTGSSSVPIVEAQGTNGGIIGNTTGGGTQMAVNPSSLKYLASGAMSTGMKGLSVLNAYSSYQAQQAYEDLANNLASGQTMSPEALSALRQLEANPGAWMDSPEVTAARNRAVDILKRQASASGQRYSGNLLQDISDTTYNVNMNMLNSRREQLASWAGIGNANYALANLAARQQADQARNQTLADITTASRDLFGKKTIGA